MNNVFKIATSVVIALVITFVLNMVFMYLLKVEVPYSYIPSVLIAGFLGMLFYKSSGKVTKVVRLTVGAWAFSFVLGFLYFSVFEPTEAQGMFAIVLFIAPAGGILGFIYGMYDWMKNKKLRLG